jgi:small-conductance mechanosensitive channel
MDYLSWRGVLVDTATQLIQKFTAFVPKLVGATILILLGWVIAVALRATIRRLCSLGLERLKRTRSIGHALERTRLQRSAPGLVGGLAYWIVLLFFVAIAVEQLELQVASSLVGELARYLPRLMLALGLILAGLVGGNIVYGVIARTAEAAGVAQGAALGRTAEVLIIFIALVIGADELGIESTLLTVVLTTVVGALFGGAALAFGFGSRLAVSNIISSHYLMKSYQVGQKVRIGDIEGRILEFNQTGVVLDGSDGRVLVPARLFGEEASILVPEGS